MNKGSRACYTGMVKKFQATETPISFPIPKVMAAAANPKNT